MHVLESSSCDFLDQVLAESNGFTLSKTCMIAYRSELEFCLAELELEDTIDAAGYIQLSDRVARQFPTLPRKIQKSLCEAPKQLEYYTTHWEQICTGEKLEFAYSVLSLALGEKMAARALGYEAHQNRGLKPKPLDIDHDCHDVSAH